MVWRVDSPAAASPTAFQAELKVAWLPGWAPMSELAKSLRALGSHVPSPSGEKIFWYFAQ
ncbi:hypothetical protein [Streptomyces sp. NPDC050528]|uniref:hypothetical protein n=1 Tax=Streptomyces sp. NPDC050528 TaxID=3365623 RepID=UPI0037895B82